MKIKMLTKFSNQFLFLVAGFLMLFSPLAGKAQNNSVVNLAGTEWTTATEVIPTGNIDNSITTLTRYLVFYKQGKVEAAIVTSKGIGMKTELVLELQPESQYNAITGSYETRMVQKQVQKFVNTPPEFNSEAWKGIYEIRGKSVYLDFPSCTIEANISSGSLKGVATYKGSREKEAWILVPLTAKQNNSSGGNSSSSSVLPKPSPKPTTNDSVGGNSNSSEMSEIQPSDLVGTWEGLFDATQYACTLEIERVEGNTFYGILKPQGGSIAVTGTIDPKTRQISFTETRIISLGNNKGWEFGNNNGSFSNNGKYISGTGVGGSTFYKWSFTKSSSSNSVGNINSSVNQPVPKVTFNEIEQDYKSNLIDETIRKTRIFLQTEPNNAKVNAMLGFSLLAKKDTDNAVVYLEKALILGDTITIPLKTVRLRGILKTFFVNDGEIIITKDKLAIREPDKLFGTELSSLTIMRLDNYQNQCPVVYMEGQFVEFKANSNKTKQEAKSFNLFPMSTTLQPTMQNNVAVNVIACNDEGIITTAIVKLLNRLRL